ncbi:uncharacterized protein [Lolium perenne]|uniref:uncharacterized protein isoform X2 n=1 Tax=Lolium perenne TaxID=4522 RepID=UPI003A9A1483
MRRDLRSKQRCCHGILIYILLYDAPQFWAETEHGILETSSRPTVAAAERQGTRQAAGLGGPVVAVEDDIEIMFPGLAFMVKGWFHPPTLLVELNSVFELSGKVPDKLLDMVALSWLMKMTLRYLIITLF